MKLITRDEMRAVEAAMGVETQVSPEILMECAGQASADAILQNFSFEVSSRGVAIVVGCGNNGADGLVVARHLHARGVRHIQILSVRPRPAGLSSESAAGQPGDAGSSSLWALQARRLQGSKVEWIHAEGTVDKISKEVGTPGVWVDAIFGIGLNRAPEGADRILIEVMSRQSRVPVVSLDVPSGLDCETGMVMGVAVRASLTLTFGLAKPGFFVHKGPEHVGRVRVLPVGFSRLLLSRLAQSHRALDRRMATRLLPRRSRVSNKARHGRVLICAGSDGYWGAGALACTAAYRTGVGYVYWGSFGTRPPSVKSVPEALTVFLDSKINLGQFQAIVVGPGLGTGSETKAWLERLSQEYKGPVVVDADGLSAFSSGWNRPLPKNWILTPHAGELSRLLGVDSRLIEENRFDFVVKAARELGGTVILKGYRTVVCSTDRRYVVLAGNSALAKAGTGDVLSGVIGSLAAQGLQPLSAALLGAYLHGRAADEWVRTHGENRSLMASDLGSLISVGLRELLERASP